MSSNCMLHMLPRLFAAIAALAAAQPCQAQADVEAAPPLTPIADILALPLEDLGREGRPVRFRGVVTLTKPLCIQADGHGVWCEIDPAASPPLALGMRVEAEGSVVRGSFAPMARLLALRILGSGPLPEPTPLDFGKLIRGRDNGVRVEVGGQPRAIVQDVQEATGGWGLFVDIASRRIQIFVPLEVMPQRPDGLVDAEIRAVGVASPDVTIQGELLVRSGIVLARAEDLVVTVPASSSPFEAPLVPLDPLARFRSEPVDGHRVCVEGYITSVGLAMFCFLQEGDVGIQIECRAPPRAQPGDRVRAAGFIHRIGPAVGLIGVELQKIPGDSPPEPVSIGPDEIFARIQDDAQRGVANNRNYHFGTLIRFPATLLERNRSSEGWVFIISTPGRSVAARLRNPTAADDAAVRAIPVGSLIEVTGVSEVGVTNVWRGQMWSYRFDPAWGSHVVLRSAADIALVRAPPWWTPRRLAAGLAGACTALAAAAAWVVLLRRQVHRQAVEMVDTMRAQREATIEFETALRERNRLAANLHDTVLQTVTGIGYQLQACQQRAAQEGRSGPDGLEVACRMVTHAAEQLRGKVWALHTLPAGGESLAVSLEALVARLQPGHDAPIRCRTSGAEPAIAESTMAALLLTGQEAIVNALRHARPTVIDVAVAHADGLVTLVVADDGVGFRVGDQPGAMQGHFGIEGMRDRMQAVGGDCRIDSRPGRGTTVTASVAAVPSEGDLSDRTGAELVADGSMRA